MRLGYIRIFDAGGFLYINLIKNIVHRILHADIVKVFSFTSVATLVKMATGLVSVKVVASIIGPAGVALVGQLNNFATIVMQLACGGINSGITKYVSENKEDKGKLRSLLSTAFRITLVCSFAVGLLMIVFHRKLSRLIMLSDGYGYVFVVFGFTVFLYALNNMLISIVNGFKEFSEYVSINIANSIVGLCFTLVFAICFGLKGALLSAISYQSVMFFVTLFMVRKLPWVNVSFFKEKFSSPVAKKYLQYTLMALVSAACLPVVQLLLRGNIISQLSLEHAGWWEGMNRISNMYLMVITTSFSVYYLPRLSEIHDKYGLKREIFKAYAVIVPMLLVGFTAIYLLRFFVIRLLFTPEFMPMEQLFGWQMTGDLFKICSWLLAYLMLAKAKTVLFVSTEIGFSLLYLALGFVLVKINGVVGLTQAYLINYIIYTIVMAIAFKGILFAKKEL